MKSVSTSYGHGTEGHVLSRSYCISAEKLCTIVQSILGQVSGSINSLKLRLVPAWNYFDDKHDLERSNPIFPRSDNMLVVRANFMITGCLKARNQVED